MFWGCYPLDGERGDSNRATMIEFFPGDRVRISATYHWARNAIGTVAEPPEVAQQLVEDHAPWDGWHHLVEGVSRTIEFYWVWFDEPQKDGDGDGPYRGGEIEADALTHV